MHRLRIIACMGLLSLGGCLTPSSGPQLASIYENASINSGAFSKGEPGHSYELVELDSTVLELLKFRTHDTLVGHFGNRRPGPGQVTVGVGDLVGVSIYEATSGGLYTPSSTDTLRQGNFITVPQQLVDEGGTISIPYGGRIPARGRSTGQIERAIVERIKDRAIEPQAVVSILDSRSSVYSVLGEVKAPGRFPINWAGERLLAGIARGGGPIWPDFATSVTLTRDGKTATAMLQTIVRDPKEDVYLRPGDTIFCVRSLVSSQHSGPLAKAGIPHRCSEAYTCGSGRTRTRAPGHAGRSHWRLPIALGKSADSCANGTRRQRVSGQSHSDDLPCGHAKSGAHARVAAGRSSRQGFDIRHERHSRRSHEELAGSLDCVGNCFECGPHWVVFRASRKIGSHVGNQIQHSHAPGTRGRFAIGLVDQDLRECCHASLFASAGRGKRSERRDTAAGRSRSGAIAKALRGAKSNVSRELRCNALPSGRYTKGCDF